MLTWVEGEQLGSIEDGLGDAHETIRDILPNDWPALPPKYITILRNGKYRRGLYVMPGIQMGWLEKTLFGGRFWELEALTHEQRELINHVREQVRQELHEYGKSSEDYSMIHADFVAGELSGTWRQCSNHRF